MSKIWKYIFILAVFFSAACLQVELLGAQEKTKAQEATLEIMLASLEGKDTVTKQTILRNIARIGDNRGIPSLIYIMLDPSEEFDTRREAAKAAMVLGGEINYAPILGLLDGKPFHCMKSIRALSDISDRRFVEPLAKYSAIDEIEESCREFAAINYLKLMGDEDSFKFSSIKGNSGEWMLMKLAGNEKSSYQEKAIFVLGEIKSRRADNVLIEALHSRKENIQKAALKALGKIQSRECFEPIGDLLSKSVSVSIKEQSVVALLGMNIKEAAAKIEKSFKNGSFQHRVIILRTLSSINDKRSKRLSDKLLASEKDPGIRKKLKEQMKEDVWD